MRFSTLSAGAAMTAMAVARELPKDDSKASRLYDSGVVHMDSMARKKAAWRAEFDAGLLDSAQWPRLNYTKCIDGKIEAVKGDPLQTFRCKNMDLYDFINHATLGSPNGWDEGGNGLLLTGSSSWGWTDPESKREFVANGMYDGTAFLEILPEGRLLQLGFLPCPAPTNDDAFWKEIRSYKNYMLIGSELGDHGIQIFDMTTLLDLDGSEVKIFDVEKDVASHFQELPEGASHNVVINEELGYGVAVGSRPRRSGCMAGLIFFDLSDPTKPTYMGCNGDDGYVHDAQCMVYRGPDKRYEGRDICYGYNEDTLTIYDVSDKTENKIISITSYEGATYTHQGWVLDPNNQEYLLMDDELDEIYKSGPAADGHGVTYIWDIKDLEKPKQTGLYKSSVPAVDHNQYIKDGLAHQSSYMAGYRVYDISSIPEDPTGDSVCEIAYLDIYPEDDGAPGGGVADMFGSWSHYAMFESGFVFINTIERGAYLAKMTKRESCPKTHKCNADNCLRAMRSTSVNGRLAESQEFCADWTDGWSADVAAVPEYASKACGANVVSRVSSACSCLPTAEPTA
ncbi:uncharacterized protein J7T54_000136 [Emericellopsis cladophorae]|uniref:Uncharacterized protein n=1 Tax=Emericellopsis cladophorae TaxID=2686198 RepID=A0A9Q0BC65_9HYPO|nr:uncharacterized protein J7T54_000136 [Emericellopsis cladophorae]KAI6780497.1 hypothetical protein J7T54_000136 [Emericellopsis cladophorae]